MKEVMALIAWLGLAWSLFLPSPAVAGSLDDPCGCNAGLAPELTHYSDDNNVSLAYLKQIDEKQYELMRQDASASGTYHELVSGSADYESFDEKRNEYLFNHSFKLTAEQSQTLIFSTVRTSDWSACKRECIRNQRGFVCGIADMTSESVAVSCSWRPEGQAQDRKVSVSIDNTQSPERTISPSTSRDWQFPRNPSKDSLLTFSLEGGSSQTIRVDAIPPVFVAAAPISQPVRLGSCIGRGGLVDVQFWGPEGEYCNGIPPWGRYLSLSTEPNPTRLCSCTGHGGVEGLRMWGPEGALCANVQGWGNYAQQCEPIENLSICACQGHGNVVGGHMLWGPRGKACGGIEAPHWGKYDQYCVSPQ